MAEDIHHYYVGLGSMDDEGKVHKEDVSVHQQRLTMLKEAGTLDDESIEDMNIEAGKLIVRCTIEQSKMILELSRGMEEMFLIPPESLDFTRKLVKGDAEDEKG